MNPLLNNPTMMTNQFASQGPQDFLSKTSSSSQQDKAPNTLEGNSLMEMAAFQRLAQQQGSTPAANPLQNFYPVDEYRNASLSEILLASEDIFADDSCEPIPITTMNGENAVAAPQQRTMSKEEQEWSQLDDSLLFANLKNQHQSSDIPVAASLVESIEATQLQIHHQQQQLQQQMLLLQMQAANANQQLRKRAREEDALLGSFSQISGSPVTSASTSDTSPQDLEEHHTGPKFRKYQEGQWAEKFQELCNYKQEFGHCLVPHTYTSNLALARWVKRQRYQYKLMKERKPCTMTQERVDALKKIGFVWDSQGAAWSERLEELKAFRQQFGTCNVPSNYEENNQLATWVKCQRRQFKLFQEGKPSNITIERIQLLSELGFEWELRNVHKKARSSY